MYGMLIKFYYKCLFGLFDYYMIGGDSFSLNKDPVGQTCFKCVIDLYVVIIFLQNILIFFYKCTQTLGLLVLNQLIQQKGLLWQW